MLYITLNKKKQGKKIYVYVYTTQDIMLTLPPPPFTISIDAECLEKKIKSMVVITAWGI